MDTEERGRSVCERAVGSLKKSGRKGTALGTNHSQRTEHPGRGRPRQGCPQHRRCPPGGTHPVVTPSPWLHEDTWAVICGRCPIPTGAGQTGAPSRPAAGLQSPAPPEQRGQGTLTIRKEVPPPRSLAWVQVMCDRLQDTLYLRAVTGFVSGGSWSSTP